MTAAGALGFQAPPGESLLAAALRQGVALPYECATGTCGTCRARLLDGEIDAGWPAAPARQALKPDRREFLTCQAKARSDCTLQPLESCSPWPDGVERPAPCDSRVVQLQPLARDMLRLVVETARPLAFQAGQFVLLQVPGVDGARAYSMANPQSQADRLEFVVKRKPDGAVSRWLFETAAPGDAVRLFGPLGAAVFEPALGHDLLLAVGGSGLAVALAVLGRADAAGYLGQHRARLFFGAPACATSAFWSS
ncbi:MAG: 2Fe-2S iron-sulfur cluster binding domain-containing protein [Rhodospirillales bacterium]|nr:2Fe-2S iron-sulfur cluster binding domain-containing protein [Rhodospirillales bacterium]